MADLIPVKDVTKDAPGVTLFEAHQKIYPHEVKGPFQISRTAVIVGVLLLYYGLCWLTWNGEPLLLFDLPARKFHIFGLIFWPQDFIYLAFLLIIAALTLFFFTALAGRLWCGYTCPQTVWTNLFMWVEKWVEGPARKRKKLDKAAWTTDKIIRKTIKHTLWVLLALWTGFTLVAYFTPARDLWQLVLDNALGPWETFWILFYGFATWGFAGFMREQVCLYMCPYARFQSAMLDDNTLVISYDKARGEPRGKPKKGDTTTNTGDCINCTLCVQVCPTGIDIRDGLQYECIGCSACIDVCNDVMKAENKPKGLIRYTTENALNKKRSHIFRPRIIIYAFVLFALSSAVIYGVAFRSTLAVDVLRDRNALYQRTDHGSITNGYTLRIMNKAKQVVSVKVSLADFPGATINAEENISIKPGEVLAFPVQVEISKELAKKKRTEFSFAVDAQETGVQTLEHTMFLAP